MTYFKLHDGAGVVRFDDNQRRKISAQLRHERSGRRGGDPQDIFADIERRALEARAKKAAQAARKELRKCQAQEHRRAIEERKMLEAAKK